MTDQGIVIGRGTLAWDLNQYALNLMCSHGYGAANTVSYQQGDAYDLSWVGGTLTMTNVHSRIINNNSDGDITLAETAIRARYDWYWGLYGHDHTYWQASREVLDPTANFPDKAQLRVNYIFELEYPE